jgi:hypothetical protein
MGKERVALQLLNDGDDTVVSANSQVVPLGHIVSEDDARSLPDSAEDREEHIPFQGLRLVDNNESVVQRTPPNMSKRQHLK